VTPTQNTRAVSWLKAAAKEFETFKTPKHEIALIADRLKRLKEIL
jgi:hypothetical protein